MAHVCLGGVRVRGKVRHLRLPCLQAARPEHSVPMAEGEWHLTISVNTVNKHTLSCTRPPGTHRANREFNTGWSDILWTEGNTTKKRGEKKKKRG